MSQEDAGLFQGFTRTLSLQLLWAAGSIAWNLYGLLQTGRNQRPPGPTASWVAVAILLVIGAGLMVTRYRRWIYVAISVVGGFLALSAVVTAFTSDPLLWPSDFSRYVGVTINGIGVLGAALAVISRSLPQKDISVTSN